MPRTRQQPRMSGSQRSKHTSAFVSGCIALFTGTYTGDNAATQAVVGVGFQPKFLLIYAQVNICLKAMKSNMDGLNTDMIEGAAQHHYETDQIISLDADGFTVGDGTGDAAGLNLLNALGTVYTYVAFSPTCPSLLFYQNTYTGDGNATQSIAGVGFQPKFVLVYSQSTPPVANMTEGLKTDKDGVNASYFFQGLSAWRYGADAIISLDVDGFTVGDTTPFANYFNGLATVYSYMCWR